MSTNSCGESVTTGAGADVGTDAEAAAEDAPEPGALARVAARRRHAESQDAERLRAAPDSGVWRRQERGELGCLGRETEAPARAGAPGRRRAPERGQRQREPREVTHHWWGPNWRKRLSPGIPLGSKGLRSLPCNGGDAPLGRGWVSTSGSHPVPLCSRRGVLSSPWGNPREFNFKIHAPKVCFPPPTEISAPYASPLILYVMPLIPSKGFFSGEPNPPFIRE